MAGSPDGVRVEIKLYVTLPSLPGIGLRQSDLIAEMQVGAVVGISLGASLSR